MKDLTKDMVSFKIETETEYTPIEKALSFETTGADHSRYIKKVQKDDGFNPWLWCCVKVTAQFKNLTGVAYLGQCAYKNEKDFIKGGYYEQMQNEAFWQLNEQVKEIINELV